LRCIHSEEGSALFLVLLVTLLLLGVGLAASFHASSATRISGNITRRQEARFAAESGLERARAVVRAASDLDALLRGCGASRDDPPPEGHGAVLCAAGQPLQDVQLSAGSATLAREPTQANLRYTVFIRNDSVEVSLNGGNWLDDEDRRVVVRVEGWARDGSSTFTLEAVLVKTEAALPVQGCRYGQAGGCGGQGSNSTRGSIEPPAVAPQP
jgi:Tfp pilus assembly protein PilX